MAYPSRPRLKPLPQFRGQAGQWLPPGRRRELEEFLVRGYLEDGRSLRELGELTERSSSEVRNTLAQLGVPMRAVGAPQVSARGRTRKGSSTA